MKPSRPRSLRVVTLIALGTLLSACGLLDVPNDVDVKAVPVDLKFGAQITKKIEPPDIGDLGEPPIIDLDLPPVEEKEEKPRKTIEVCPVTTADAARAPSKGEIKSFEESPVEGSYFTYFEGQFPDAGFQRAVAYKTVEDVEENSNGTEYAFTVRDDNILLGLEMGFRVVYTQDEGVPDGISLTKMVLPRHNDDGSIDDFAFVPQPPLGLMDFPINPGAEKISTGVDNEPKTEAPAENPLGGGLLAPSGNNMRSTLTVGSREIIEVCADLAQAWRTNWKIEITGEYDVTLTGTFWFDTSEGKGGVPIRTDFVLEGNVEEGIFLSSILRLDPGDLA